ncbi:Uncharacterized conserved protein, DUF1501 family [Alteromonadaceae bacterium Bs31]|nr:Uncharacterized conserved protein, DUF1501 family [Alteromonadaceae bacterium Bs31]
MNRKITRRHFFNRCNALALGSSSSLATLTSLQLAHAQTEPAENYKALVCVFLFGGNDAFNMVVPRNTDAYDTYAASRRELKVEQQDLIAVNNTQQAGMEFGLHPALADIAKLYTDGKLAVLANVGALVEPTSKAAYQSKSVALPPQLFSHNDQQNFVQSLQSSQRRDGWAGRAAERLSTTNVHPSLSMNISLSGSNLWQSAGSIIPYSVNPSGIQNIRNLDRKIAAETQDWGEIRERARVSTMEKILKLNQAHILAREYGSALNKAWDLSDEVGTALNAAAPITTAFPSDNRLGDSLKMAANMISVRSALGASRQTFFIGVGDFDTHGDQVRRHNLLMAQLNDALAAFYKATVELGIADKVTTFTASDFGRTLTSNGDGTDHGWGSHQLIMGDAVKGADIFGTMPDLAIGSNDDMGEGRIIPTTSMDQYGATLASWFGLQGSAFAEVFPNLLNFDTTDLGFMKS